MQKPMTHLEAFLSDDGKRGRIWKGSDGEYMRRANGDYMYRADKDDEWGALRQQVASAEGTVTWADEPKTLTPQKMVDAIGDIIGDNGCDCDCECGNPRRECICEDVEPCLACKICDVIQPQFARVRPSQPAEPQETPDIVTLKKGPYAFLQDAEPNVEYPLTWDDVMPSMDMGLSFCCELAPERVYRDLSTIYSGEGVYLPDGFPSYAERKAKWRIVDGGK